MPSYDYECQECDYEFEAFHGMLESPLVDCPKCNRPSLVKLISAGAAAIVKGTTNPCIGRRGSKIDVNKQKNKKKDKMGEGKHKFDPWWRNGRINKKILKNPEQYIKDGKVK